MNKSRYIHGSVLPEGLFWRCKHCGRDVNKYCLKNGKKEAGKEILIKDCEFKDSYVLKVRAYEPGTNRTLKQKIKATEKHLIDLEAANFKAFVKGNYLNNPITNELDKIVERFMKTAGVGNEPKIIDQIGLFKKELLKFFNKNDAIVSTQGIYGNTNLPGTNMTVIVPPAISSNINLVDLINEYLEYHSNDVGRSILKDKRNISTAQKKSVRKTLERLQGQIKSYGKDIQKFAIFDFDDDLLYFIQEDLKKNYADSSFDKILQDLIAFENWIDKIKFNGNIPVRIFKQISKKNPEVTEPDTLNSEEYLKISNSTGKDNDPHIKYGFVIAKETGFRMSNLANLKYSEIFEDINGNPGVIRYPDNKSNKKLNRKGNQLKYLFLPCTKQLQEVLINEFDYKKNKKKDMYIISPNYEPDNKTMREKDIGKLLLNEFKKRVKNAKIERHITFTIMRNTVMTQSELFTNQFGQEWAMVFHKNPKNDRHYKAEIKKHMVYAGWELFLKES